MGKNTHLASETITQVFALHQAGHHQTKQIVDLTGVSYASVKMWIQEFKAEGSHNNTYNNTATCPSGHSMKLASECVCVCVYFVGVAIFFCEWLCSKELSKWFGLHFIPCQGTSSCRMML